MNATVIPKVAILGSRGIPSKYGGFETFAQRLALYLTAQGWLVTVYCQDSEGEEITETEWQGIRLINIPADDYGALSSISFDWKSTVHAANQDKDTLILTLGYNTAIFCSLYRFKGLNNLINMDGLEWKRQKWKAPEKAWLYLNEWFGSWLGNHLIADHPEIKNHLSSRVSPDKITVIPYCSEPIANADASLISPYGVEPNQYALIIARAEPENYILEIVKAFSRQKRGMKLIILGNYKPDELPYHKTVLESASEEVDFVGAIYDIAVTTALRVYSRIYIHGHSVGGTNPSLVEALACGSAVLAHDNPFNNWVAGEKAHFFKDEEECSQELDDLLANDGEIEQMKQWSIHRFEAEFSDDRDVKNYEKLMKQFLK